jgi:hypothetical protein
MLLAASIIALLVSVAGIIVAALAVPDSVAKRRSIYAAIVLGAVWVMVTIIAYEQTPGNPLYFSDAIALIRDRLSSVVSNHLTQIFAAIGLGLGIGWGLKTALDRKREAAAFKALEWKVSYDFLNLAERSLVEAHKQKRVEAERINDKFKPLYEAYMKLGAGVAGAVRESTAEEEEIDSQRDTLNAELQAITKQRDNLYIQMQQNVHDKLTSGELVAKGFLMPLSPKPIEIIIPKEQWRFLRFRDNFQKASGEGISYTGVAVASRSLTF